MEKKPYSIELIEKFVKEWKRTSNGKGSFDKLSKNYPEDFKIAWLEMVKEEETNPCQHLFTWEDAKGRMIDKLYTRRTKLGQIL